MYEINHNLKLGRHKLTDVVRGLENSVALNKIFGKKLKWILNTTMVDVVSNPWQIWVSRETEIITINKNYLFETDKGTLYLDFVHEMVHIWQVTEGKDVFNRSVSYVDSPTEIEAYRYTVKDAERIGFSKKDIVDYLKVRWIDNEEHKRLVKAVITSDRT
jgi:hypothetical protein